MGLEEARHCCLETAIVVEKVAVLVSLYFTLLLSVWLTMKQEIDCFQRKTVTNLVGQCSNRLTAVPLKSLNKGKGEGRRVG